VDFCEKQIQEIDEFALKIGRNVYFLNVWKENQNRYLFIGTPITIEAVVFFVFGEEFWTKYMVKSFKIAQSIPFQF
jgi:hypothetical protein